MSKERFNAYIMVGRKAANQKNISWEVPVDSSGAVEKRLAWNLTSLAGETPPPIHWFSSFLPSKAMLRAVNEYRGASGLEVLPKGYVSSSWQDLMKAAVAESILIRKNHAAPVLSSVLKPIASLAASSYPAEPWEVRRDDVDTVRRVAESVSPKLAMNIDAVVQRIFDAQGLSAYCPIGPAKRGRASTVKRDTRKVHSVRTELSERKAKDKLPAELAFWEIAKIAFTSSALSFADKLRFAIVRTLILTGLRATEVSTIPEQWRGKVDYFDIHGRSAGESGGFSSSMLLKYFGEKQRVTGGDKIAVYPTAQHIPPMFEEMLSNTLDEVRRLTSPLRERLRSQIQTGRLFPELPRNGVIPILEAYTKITGDPFVVEDPKKSELVARYKQDFSADALTEIRERQDRLLRAGIPILKNIRVYFAGKLGANIGVRAPARDRAGNYMERIKYDEAIFNVGEFEDYLTKALPTKLPDITPFRLSDGSDLTPDNLLFLAPKRALAEERNDGICDYTQYAFVGRMTFNDFSSSLSGSDNTTPSLFEKYSDTPEAKQYSITAHMFRHLQNTELFRLGVADTIISKRFNRQSVAQSYDYDHRSLAEELSFISVPKSVEPLLSDRSLAAYKLIAANKISGPLVDEFRKIQREENDEAAFVFLATEADGFHTTPYGHCINSFTVEPCPKALECFSGCRHLTVSGMPSHVKNLTALRERYIKLIDSINEHPAPDKAKSKMFIHARQRLESIDIILATQSGQKPFPDGPDLFSGISQTFRGPFSDA